MMEIKFVFIFYSYCFFLKLIVLVDSEDKNVTKKQQSKCSLILTLFEPVNRATVSLKARPLERHSSLLYVTEQPNQLSLWCVTLERNAM